MDKTPDPCDGQYHRVNAGYRNNLKATKTKITKESMDTSTVIGLGALSITCNLYNFNI